MSARSLGAIWCDRRATGAIEFALTAPALVILVLAILALGWTINGMASMRHALEQSGRALTVSPAMTASQFDALVKSKVAPLDPSNVSTTLSAETLSGGVKLVQATASYSFKIVIPALTEQELIYTTSIVVPLNAM